MKSFRALPALLCALFCVSCASAHAATFVVTNNSDTIIDGICTVAGTGDGCTLREAIQAANNAAGADNITFSAGAFSTAQTIALSGTVLPPITGDLTLTGPAARLTINAGGAPNGFQINSGNVRISSLTVTGATNQNGGIFQNYQSGANLTLTNITLSGNSLGLYIASGSATVINSTISDNHNPSSGGGVFNGAGASTTLVNSTISGNSADYDVGGIYNGGGSTLVVNNCTISGNSAQFNGGGIYNFGTVTLTNSTLSGNSAGNGGAGIYSRSGSTLNISNTILNNSAGGNLIGSGTVTVASHGYNISSDGTGPSTGSNDRLNTDPKLGPLANNGGPTLTHALLAGSPAIDAGNATGLDQRGRERPFDVSGVANAANGSDIGAVEQGATATAQNGPNFVVNSTADSDDGGCGTIHCTLREALNAANNDGVNSTISFRATVFAAPRKTITLGGQELLIVAESTLNITAPAAGVEISGNNQSRVFHVDTAANVTLSGLTISGGNSPDNLGGGAIVNYGTLNLSNSTLINNSAGLGGGIANYHTVNLTNSALISNRAQFNGGGIYNLFILTVSNSTFNSNSAGSDGGGIYNGNMLTLTNSTFSANLAVLGGGICNLGPLTIGNTILNRAGAIGDNLYGSGPVTSQGYNISSDGSGPNTGTNDRINIDPKLGPLANNGGPTLTHALLAGSPALNAGNTTLTTDQRGVARPQGARDDIGAYEALYLQIADASLTEGNSGTTNMSFTVTLSGAVSAPVSLNYVVSNGSARSGSDYGASSSDSDGGTPGTLTLAANQTTGTITVPIVGDLLDEPNELFYVLISSPVGAFISRGRAIGTINDNDLPPSITVDNPVVVEGNSGERFATFALRLSSPSGQAVRVTVQTANPAQGTPAATAGSDYTALAPTVVTFTVGASAAIARVLVQGDMLDEPNENFVLNLSTPVNATIADNQGVASISDDDATPSLAINDVSVIEGPAQGAPAGTKTLTFTVTKTGLNANDITVNYATANGIARSDSDYVAKNGTLTFAPGVTTQTVSITINGDTLVEADETFYVILSGATNAAIGRGRGVGTIQNDDASG